MDITKFNAWLTVINKFFIVSNKVDKTLKKVRSKAAIEVVEQSTEPVRRKRINKRRSNQIKDF